ncbi:myc target protein 1 homolog [Gadus macrocephalus]|uniref:myc target protein 1 homolog n=1 Tax=Gadus macrocephalus TaxID=80720 RepID=UPI0028CB639A|nr:myc target protein 1 homolog [Gadus macrocephalus]
MAENNTNLFLEILQSFDVVPLIIAFCVSIAVGLLLGALIYVLLTWLSRRRAGSAVITQRPLYRPALVSPRARPGFSRNSSYDRRSNNSLVSAAFSFHRQLSPPGEQADPLGRKSSFRASTFYPLRQCSQIAREAEEGSPGTPPRTQSLTAAPGSAHTAVGTPTTAPAAAAAPARPESFWGHGGVRGFQATQTPPPAYESIVKAYQETRT